MEFERKESYTIDDLLEIIKILRSPEGCPWDQKQTHQSIRRNFIEETYEVVEAIDNGDTALLREELGDVLLQIVFHAEMEREIGSFDFCDVCNDICQKLVFRHPHVFGDYKANDPDEALGFWEASKQLEKNQHTATETLKQVSKSLPALIYSEKVQKRAAKTGFDYEQTQQVLDHWKAELLELEEAIQKEDSSAIYEEFGDLLFSAVNAGRFLHVDPEKALMDSTAKFIGRFEQVELLASERGIALNEADLNQLNCLWEEAKNIEKILEVIYNDKG